MQLHGTIAHGKPRAQLVRLCGAQISSLCASGAELKEQTLDSNNHKNTMTRPLPDASRVIGLIGSYLAHPVPHTIQLPWTAARAPSIEHGAARPEIEMLARSARRRRSCSGSFRA
ncbi:hypothetical protein TRVL_08057 [Trypanosoma vivax]|nr:hypothetical protein TRVL_08057 [Trypanosoma vivax]